MLYRSLRLVTAPHIVSNPKKEKRREEKRREEKRKESPSPTALWEPLVLPFLQITSALTSPTLVFPKNLKTASVYLSSDNNSLIVILLRLALACRT